MSAPKHTPEPWVAGWGGGITGPNAATMLQWDYKFPIHRVSDWCGPNREAVLALPTTDPAHEANAGRIVACVNACAGMDDPAAEIAALRASEESRHYDQAAHLACLKQRDSLAAALREIASNDPYKVSSAGIIARAALAKLDGAS